MSPDEYESETTADRAEIASVLSGVADGVLAGSIRLGEGPEATSVAVPDEMDLEIEFETEPGEASLEMELEWSVPDDEDDAPVADSDSSEADRDADGADREAPATDSVADGADREAPAEASTTDQDAAETAIADPVGAAEPSQSLARFEVFRDRADEWRWRLRHRNGNVIASSGEGYTRKHNAWKGLRSVMTNAPGAEVSENDV